MLTKLVCLCLLPTVFCQNKTELDVVITPPSSNSSVNISTASPDDGVKKKPEVCSNWEGKEGECIPYYECKAELPPSDLIDIGISDDACSSYIDICCLASERLDMSVTSKNDTQPKSETSTRGEPLLREGCGWRNPEGLEGSPAIPTADGEAKIAEFPWICAIFRIDPVNVTDAKNQEVNYIGGGSLIHPSVVLTAAHLVSSDGELRVRAGEWDSQTTKEPYPHQDRQVTSKVVHEDFAANKLYYDVAVLFLEKPMDMAPNVGLACLPPPRQRTPEGLRCFAMGWGKDKFGKEGKYSVILKKVEVPAVERTACRTQLRKTRLGPLFELHTSFMCAGGELGKDTCKGDGGSPLSCPIEYEKDRYMQSGIVAWGIGCGEDGTPGVYVDVSNLRSWVDDKVAGKGYDPKVYSI